MPDVDTVGPRVQAGGVLRAERIVAAWHGERVHRW
jgi:hypothetical protein